LVPVTLGEDYSSVWDGMCRVQDSKLTQKACLYWNPNGHENFPI